MPYDGNGNFIPIPPPDYPAVPGTTISSTHYNNYTADLMSGLTNCVTRDGQSVPTGNLPMGGFRHTGVGQALAADQYATLGQLTATAASFSSLTGYRNKIINGDFSIWQRGTSQSTQGYGSADRWACQSAGSSFLFTRNTFTIGQITVPSNPTYYPEAGSLSVAGAGNFVKFCQRIENVSAIQNTTVRLSFWAKADASRPIAIEVVQNFGVGGSSPVTSIGSQQFNLTTAWTKFSASIIIPSILGKTVDIATSYTEVNFWLDAGSSFSGRTAGLGQQTGVFNFSLIQLEIGTIDSAFEVLPASEVLALCQRYCQAYGGDTADGFIAGGQATSSNTAQISVYPTMTMYRPPTITSTGAFRLSNIGGGNVAVTSLSPVAGYTTRNLGAFIANTAGGLAQGNATHFSSGNSLASRLILDAEI